MLPRIVEALHFEVANFSARVGVLVGLTNRIQATDNCGDLGQAETWVSQLAFPAAFLNV